MDEDEEEEGIALSDFEVTDCEDEYIYLAKCDESLWAAKEARSKRFQPWARATSTNKG